MEDDDVEEDEEKDENVAEDEVEDGDVAEDEVEDDDVEDDEVEVKEEEDDDVENDDVEEEEDDDVEDDYVEHDDVEEEDRSQDLGPHFVRACAAQMHINMSQETFFLRKFTGKMPQTRTAAHTLCEPWQPKRTSTFHKSHFIQKFTGKMPRATETTKVRYINVRRLSKVVSRV